MQEDLVVHHGFDIRVINLRSLLHGMTDGDVIRLNRLVGGLDAQAAKAAGMAGLRAGLDPSGRLGREFAPEALRELRELLDGLAADHGDEGAYARFAEELARHNALRTVPENFQKIEPKPLFNPSKWLAICIILGLALYFVRKYLSLH